MKILVQALFVNSSTQIITLPLNYLADSLT